MPEKPPRKDRTIRIFQGWGGLRILHFEWLLGEYPRWWYMAGTYLLLIDRCNSVVCAWNISKHPRSDLQLWDLMILLFSHWHNCCRKGWRKIWNDCMTYDEIGAIQFFSVVSCYILMLPEKNILTAWCDFSSNVLWTLRLEATDTRLGHWMWYDVIGWSFPHRDNLWA